MIRCNNINRAIFKSTDNCLSVRLLTKRGIHFCHSSILYRCFFCQGKMMGGCFRMNIISLFLGLTHQLYRFLGTDVLNVNTCSQLQCQLQVTLHQGNLCLSGRTANSEKFTGFSTINSIIGNQRGIFLMKADRHVQLGSLLHCFTHKYLIHQRNTIICKAYRSKSCQFFHGYQFFSL